jgi:hypothetical protein
MNPMSQKSMERLENVGSLTRTAELVELDEKLLNLLRLAM